MSSASAASSGTQSRAKYLPLPAEKRAGSALCLSGGGYRAALFHLGVCRRLNELGVLGNLDMISAVSGGSIFAAHLACALVADPKCLADYEQSISVPFREFVSHDIRTGPALTRLLPWEWWNAGAGAEALADQYDNLLVKGMPLERLPVRPDFVFCATDLSFGVSWVFSRCKVGDYQAGYMGNEQAAAVPLARAVAASSCFPPVFRPLPMQLQPGDLHGGDAAGKPDRDDYVRQLALSDGGVYDNMGLEPVWKTHRSILVSNGGKPFQFAKEHDTPHQLYRLVDVMGNQAEALRKRWLIAGFLRQDFSGAFFGIHNSVSDYPVAATDGYSKSFAVDVISKFRTDMDRFSADEIAVLENHGYTLADAAYRSHVDSSIPAMTPIDNSWWPADGAGHLEDKLREALVDSSVVHILGH